MEIATLPYTNGATHTQNKLTSEIYGGELYEYYPLGNYIVAAPGVCGGRPTFKYTRLEVSMILAFLGNGETITALIEDYALDHLHFQAISEAILLASQMFVESFNATTLALAAKMPMISSTGVAGAKIELAAELFGFDPRLSITMNGIVKFIR